MTKIEQIAHEWMEDWGDPERKPKAFSRQLDRKCRGSSEEAEEAWLIILEIVSSDLTGKQRSLLAAGPMEYLLSAHGDAFIERTEKRAATDAKFNLMLGGVWRLSMSEEVWQRVQKARTQIL